MLDVRLRRKLEASQRTTDSQIKASKTEGGGACVSQPFFWVGTRRRSSDLLDPSELQPFFSIRRRALSSTRGSGDIWGRDSRNFFYFRQYGRLAFTILAR